MSEPSRATSNDTHRRCLGCNYILDHLATPRCPECGRPFDPNIPETYQSGPVAPLTVEHLYLALLLVVGAMLVIPGPWYLLHWLATAQRFTLLQWLAVGYPFAVGFIIVLTAASWFPRYGPAIAFGAVLPAVALMIGAAWGVRDWGSILGAVLGPAASAVIGTGVRRPA